MRVKKSFNLKRNTLTAEEERDELLKMAESLPDIIDLGDLNAEILEADQRRIIRLKVKLKETA